MFSRLFAKADRAPKVQAVSPEKRHQGISELHQQNIPLLDLNTAIRRAFSALTFMTARRFCNSIQARQGDLQAVTPQEIQRAVHLESWFIYLGGANAS